MSSDIDLAPPGLQRHSVDRLDRWRALEYGMFIHFGMSTFSPNPAPNHARGDFPIELYQPETIDVAQWVRVARDAGMRYAILTAKHVNGFALWPTRHSDYSVAHAGNKTDVVGAFVDACRKAGLRPALYINCGDDHNLPDQQVKAADKRSHSFATRRYLDFMLAQIEELLSGYGELEQMWFDGPTRIGAAGRREVYDRCVALQPDMIVAMNGMWEDDGRFPHIKPYAWPTDVHVIEAGVPPIWGTCPWRELEWDPMGRVTSGKNRYYLPIETCTIAHEGGSSGWWWSPTVQARNIEELLGLRLLCRARNSNLVLNVTPDRRGRIPDDQVDALLETERRLTRCLSPAKSTQQGVHTC